MNRILTAFLAATIVIGPVQMADVLVDRPAHPVHPGPCGTPWWKSYVRPTMPARVIVSRGMWVTRCAFARYDPADVHTALYVMSRESGGWPWATNPDDGGSCQPYGDNAYGSCGLWQHLARYWPGRVVAFLRREWWPGVWPRVPVFDIRAQALITARMFAAQGGPCPAWC